MHLVKTRTAARNRIFGLLTQFGLRAPIPGCEGRTRWSSWRHAGAAVWRASIAELIELAEEMDRRIIPLDRELAPLARADERVRLLATMPGIGPLLGLNFAAEIGEVSGSIPGQAGRLRRPRPEGEPVGRALGDRRLSKAGPRTLRWAAVEAANQAWRPANPWHGHYLRISARHGKNPAKSAVARKLLISA